MEHTLKKNRRNCKKREEWMEENQKVFVNVVLIINIYKQDFFKQ